MVKLVTVENPMRAAPLFAFLCFFACMLNSPGRIGDSLDQCIKRWGQPVDAAKQGLPKGEVGDAAYEFLINGYYVTAIIFNKTVGGEVIAKADKSDFSDNEKETLLASEGNGLQPQHMIGVNLTPFSKLP